MADCDEELRAKHCPASYWDQGRNISHSTHQNYSHFLHFQQKGLEKGLDNVTGGLNLGLGLLGGGKPDVKNVMNVVSVSKLLTQTEMFYILSIIILSKTKVFNAKY